jgi:hypothetical protein
MLSPRSRGKGSRRAPGRDGGRGKRVKEKAVAWRKRAVHAVDEFPKNCGDIVELYFSVPFGLSAAESIYLFDQCIATTGIRYQAELRGSGNYSSFVIRVPASIEPKVKDIIAQIMRR